MTTDNNYNSFISGGIAGIIAKTSIAPFERVKVIFQVNHIEFSYNNFFNELIHIYKKNGITNLFRGNILNCIRIFPYSSIVI